MFVAFLKILKKHDRITGSHIRRKFCMQTLNNCRVGGGKTRMKYSLRDPQAAVLFKQTNDDQQPKAIHKLDQKSRGCK